MEIDEIDFKNYDLDHKLKFTIKNREYIYVIAKDPTDQRDDDEIFRDVSNHYRIYHNYNTIYNGLDLEDTFLAKFQIMNIIPLNKFDKMYNLFLCSEFNYNNLNFIKEKFFKEFGKRIEYLELRYNYVSYFDALELFNLNRRKEYYEIDYRKKIYFFVPLRRYDLKLEVKKKYDELKGEKGIIIKKFITKNKRYYNL